MSPSRTSLRGESFKICHWILLSSDYRVTNHISHPNELLSPSYSLGQFNHYTLQHEIKENCFPSFSFPFFFFNVTSCYKQWLFSLWIFLPFPKLNKWNKFPANYFPLFLPSISTVSSNLDRVDHSERKSGRGRLSKQMLPHLPLPYSR